MALKREQVMTPPELKTNANKAFNDRRQTEPNAAIKKAIVSKDIKKTRDSSKPNSKESSKQ